MTEKEKKQVDETKPTEKAIVTTNDPVNPKRKSKALQTRDLPCFLPGYHGRKGQ